MVENSGSVCSPIDKPTIARLVVGSVTTSESLVLYVFSHYFLQNFLKKKNLNLGSFFPILKFGTSFGSLLNSRLWNAGVQRVSLLGMHAQNEGSSWTHDGTAGSLGLLLSYYLACTPWACALLATG